MKSLTIVVFSLVLALAGCADKSVPVSAARKEALRKTLDPKFTFSLPAKDVEEELYRVLDAFAEGRRADELVREVEFISRSEAQLSFSDSGMHGGGSATLKKKDGRWTVVMKLHTLWSVHRFSNLPNKAPEPTPTSVTPPAVAGVAPAAVVAHL